MIERFSPFGFKDEPPRRDGHESDAADVEQELPHFEHISPERIKSPEPAEPSETIENQHDTGAEKVPSVSTEETAATKPREETGSTSDTEIVERGGEHYTVEYVPRAELYPAFGYQIGDRALVRWDLPQRVKRFVREHELYHCQDKATWGGWVGREIRANLIPGMKDPVGLLATVWATVSDLDRMKFYAKRLRDGR